MKSKIKNIVIIILIVYLIISSIYILFHINFDEEPKYVGPGFSNSNNILRLFMGLPKTCSTYEGVPPIFLIEVLIKIVLAGILIMYLKKTK